MEIYLIAVGVIIFAVLVYIISLYNKAVRFGNIIPENRSNIEVLRKKKEHLISKMLAIVDSYGLHEKGIMNNASDKFGEGQSTTGNRLVERLSYLRMAFPELKADSLYNQLLTELANVETDIASRREEFNVSVRAYNTTLTLFPANIFLKLLGFRPKDFLSIDDINS